MKKLSEEIKMARMNWSFWKLSVTKESLCFFPKDKIDPHCGDKIKQGESWPLLQFCFQFFLTKQTFTLTGINCKTDI